MCLWQSVDVEANLAITRYLDIQIQPILPGGATCIAKLPGINLTPDGRIELASSSTRVISVESTKGVPRSRSCPWSSLHCCVLWCTTIDMAETTTFFIFTQIMRCVNSLSLCHSTTNTDRTTNTINIVLATNTTPLLSKAERILLERPTVFSMNPLRDEMTTFS